MSIAQALVDELEDHLAGNLELVNNKFEIAGDRGCLIYEDGEYYMYKHRQRIDMPEISGLLIDNHLAIAPLATRREW